MTKLGLLKISLALLAATVSVGGGASPFKDFDGVWSARAASYEGQRIGLESRVKQTGDKLGELFKANDPGAYNQMLAFLGAERDLAELKARKAMLEDLRHQMERKPSFAITQAWFQGKLDEINALNRRHDELIAPLRASMADGKPKPNEYYTAVETAAIMLGDINGRVEELTLLQQNLSTLYAAKAEGDQRRRAALAAFGAALATAGQQAQSQNWTATCLNMGSGMTTCNGH